MVVLGEIRATLAALSNELGAPATAANERTIDVAALAAQYASSGKRPSDALILGVLRQLDPATHIITEGSSEDAIVQDMAVRLGFRNVHFSPRGGWTRPLRRVTRARRSPSSAATRGRALRCGGWCPLSC